MDGCQIRAGLLLFAVASVLASVPRSAQADDAGKASRLLRQANQQCAGEQPEAALPIYERAIEAKPLPQIYLAYGDCLRQLGQYDRAIEQYRQYQQAAKRPKDREQAENLIKACQEQREGAAAARPPTGPPDQSATAELPPDLKATPPPPRVPTPAERRRRFAPVYFWTGVGVTAALLAAGTACGVVTIVKGNRYNDLTTPYEELQGLKDTGEALKLTSTIAFVASGATAIATTVLFFFTRFKAPESVSAAPVPGGGMVVMGGRF
jgi:tetratricopeptide (TPR) repeat protein